MLQTKKIILPQTTYKKRASIYSDTNVRPKACLLYFHGGGLLYGSRDDLPELHLETMTRNGYAVISFDYPLAPFSKLEVILEDVLSSINHYIAHAEDYLPAPLPYFLWGRSAGAYLCLLAAASGKLLKAPAGVVSFYGYGFLCDNWYDTPSKYYLSLPAVPDTCLDSLPDKAYAHAPLSTYYNIYVYARQSGSWKSLLYEGREKFFFLNYSLRTYSSLGCPLFCAHSTNDTDVPFSEFQELCSRYAPQRFIASGDVHDFDRDTENPFTLQLLHTALLFLDKQI